MVGDGRADGQCQPSDFAEELGLLIDSPTDRPLKGLRGVKFEGLGAGPRFKYPHSW